MPKEARLSFGRDSGGAGGTNWNDYLVFPVLDASVTKDPLVDIADGSDTGWDTVGFTPDNNNSTTNGWTGAVSASWVSAAAAAQSWYLNSGESITVRIRGLDNAKTYQIDVYGARDITTGRFLNVTIGGTNLGEQDVGTTQRTWQRTGVAPSSGQIDIVFAYGASATQLPVFNALRIIEESSGLSITSVTPSSFDDGRTGIVIAGSGFGASQGSSTLTIGGQAQTVTAWSDTSITFTSVRGSNSMGARSLTITRA